MLEANDKKRYKKMHKKVPPYPTFTCSKSTIQTPEKGVKNIER